MYLNFINGISIKRSGFFLLFGFKDYCIFHGLALSVLLIPLRDTFSIPSRYLFLGYFDRAIRGTTFLPSFCHFAGQISYPFDFISWRNLLVECYGNGRSMDAIFRQAQSQKFKVLDLRNITSNTLSTNLANA